MVVMFGRSSAKGSVVMEERVTFKNFLNITKSCPAVCECEG